MNYIRSFNFLSCTEEFYVKYRRHYDLARNDTLVINEYKPVLPSNLQSQTFIEQLIEIDDIEEFDIEEIARLTGFKLKLQNNLDEWLQQGEITGDEISDFKNDAIEQWRNKYRRSYRGVNDQKDYNKIALKVIDDMREINLTIAQQPLDTSLSNGTLYDLSDYPVIGWRKDWEKYKK